MSRQRFVLLLVAALVAIAAALLLANQRNSSRGTQGAALLPALAAHLDAVSGLTIAKGGSVPATTLEKGAGGWTVKERAGYPADIAKLRKLLTSLADAKIVEEKTADPARYALLGVEDPLQPGATGSEITVLMPDGGQAVIIGKSVGAGNYVRRAAEKQSYSIAPGIPVEVEAQFWIDSRLLDLPVTKIQRMEVKPPGGPLYAVQRSTTDSTFSLEGAPAGRQALQADALAPAPTTFTGLTAEDVAPVDGIDFSQPFTTTLTLADGDVITLTGAVAGTKHWVQVTSTKDAALTARAKGRAFEVASYRYDAIFKPVEQLLVPKAPATPAPAHAHAHAPKKT
jgi:hypothetical protein